jgi:hypothetical protein
MVQTTKFRGELQEQILEMKHSFTRIFSLLISPSCLSDFILLSFLRSHILAILMYVGLILFSNVFFFFPEKDLSDPTWPLVYCQTLGGWVGLHSV